MYNHYSLPSSFVFESVSFLWIWRRESVKYIPPPYAICEGDVDSNLFRNAIEQYEIPSNRYWSCWNNTVFDSILFHILSLYTFPFWMQRTLVNSVKRGMVKTPQLFSRPVMKSPSTFSLLACSHKQISSIDAIIYCSLSSLLLSHSNCIIYSKCKYCGSSSWIRWT